MVYLAGCLAALLHVSLALSLSLCVWTGLCQAVLDARAAQMRAAMLVYTDAEVMVEVIQKADLPTAFTNSVGGKVYVIVHSCSDVKA